MLPTRLLYNISLSLVLYYLLSLPPILLKTEKPKYHIICNPRIQVTIAKTQCIFLFDKRKTMYIIIVWKGWRYVHVTQSDPAVWHTELRSWFFAFYCCVCPNCHYRCCRRTRRRLLFRTAWLQQDRPAAYGEWHWWTVCDASDCGCRGCYSLVLNAICCSMLLGCFSLKCWRPAAHCAPGPRWSRAPCLDRLLWITLWLAVNAGMDWVFECRPGWTIMQRVYKMFTEQRHNSSVHCH